MSLSERYAALVPAMDRQIEAVKAMVENCHRAKEVIADGDRPARKRGDGQAGAALLGAILGGVIFGERGGAAQGSPGRAFGD